MPLITQKAIKNIYDYMKAFLSLFMGKKIVLNNFVEPNVLKQFNSLNYAQYSTVFLRDLRTKKQLRLKTLDSEFQNHFQHIPA